MTEIGKDRTFADILRTLSGYFPISLVSSREFTKVLNVVENFPALMFSIAGFESRLKEETPTLDVSLCIEKEKRDILASQHPHDKMAEKLLKNGTWKRIQAFCQEWAIPNSLSDQYLNKLWFEFDIKGEPEVSIPALFLGINEIYQDYPEELNFDWIFDHLRTLKTSSIASKTVKNVLLCHAKLPQGARINYVGFMASRNPDVLRINVSDLNETSIFQFLDGIGLGDRIPQLEESLSDSFQFVDYMVLALDVGEEISTKLGVEFRFLKDELSLATQTKWHPFLDYLVEKDMCTNAKREAFIDWSGGSREIFDPDLCRFFIFRFIHYIKAVYVPDFPPEIKGYFSMIFRPIQ